MFSNIMAVIFLALVVYLMISNRTEVDPNKFKESRNEAKAKKDM